MAAVDVPLKYISLPYCGVEFAIEQDDTTGRLLEKKIWKRIRFLWQQEITNQWNDNVFFFYIVLDSMTFQLRFYAITLRTGSEFFMKIIVQVYFCNKIREMGWFQNWKQRTVNQKCEIRRENTHLGVKFPIEPVVAKFRCISIGFIAFSVGECWPIVGDDGLFFHGWKPLPIAASANGGGDLFDNLLHCAASIANGVLRSCEWSWNQNENDIKLMCAVIRWN